MTAAAGDGRPGADEMQQPGELVDPEAEAAFRRQILIEADDALHARLLARVKPPAEDSDAQP
jgi:hypothetical protein